jgi:ribosomal-protein-alanine N-acetyltransferase
MKKNEDIRIRKASTEDLPAVYAIEKESFKDPYPPFFIDLLLRLNPETFLIAEEEGKILGYVVASQDRNAGNIVSIAVTPKERGRNIGRRLMEEVLHLLKDSRAETVRLEVRKSNTGAQRFYELLGFEYSHEAFGYYGDEDAKVYYKTLTAQP